MDSIMNLVNNNFMLLKENGRHKLPQVLKEKILALQAELEIFSDKYTQGLKSHGKNKSKTTATTKKIVDWKNKQAKKKEENTSWMLDKPKEGNIRKTKFWSNKYWLWYSIETGGKCKGYWHIHKPSKYEGRSHNLSGHNNQIGPAKNSSSKNKLRLTSSISEIQEGDRQRT